MKYGAMAKRVYVRSDLSRTGAVMLQHKNKSLKQTSFDLALKIDTLKICRHLQIPQEKT